MRSRNYRQEKDPKLLERIRLIEQTDPEYPERFHEYRRMPNSFYVLGELPDPKGPVVAIVGSRACSEYGRTQAVRFGKAFAEHGIQVISGMAYGVDAWAQHGAIEAGGRTFSVLGTGVDVCYPDNNYVLYRRIIREGGGILSEFPPGTGPDGWHFPIRNRLISAWADLVLVVEARLKSGSLITADYAMEQGKTVYAVPGRNDDVNSQGCNRLISQGAGIAWNPETILQEFGIAAEDASVKEMIPDKTHSYMKKSVRKGGENRERTAEAQTEARPGTRLPKKWEHADDFQKVYGFLNSDPQQLDTLAMLSGLDLPSLTGVLMQLCISGYAIEPFPGYYCRS